MNKISTNSQDFQDFSYHSVFASRYAFRRAGARDDSAASNFNRFDNPNTLFFKIFFDFGKGLLNVFNDWGGNVPSEEFLTNNQGRPGEDGDQESALNYLIRNNEWERADMLRDFIHLLSNINIYSPWYFNELTGLGEILDRTEFTGEIFTIGERKAIGIKTLPDSQDTRIGTLLDLYRSICYSWQLHKEILPANLRKFDMYVYLFSVPKRGIHDLYKPQTDNNSINRSISNQQIDENSWATFEQPSTTFNPNKYVTSSKLIHLTDCEIDLNSIKSAYGEVKNEEGFSQTYEIGIKVNNAIEQRYNEFLMKEIGDLVLSDMDMNLENITDPTQASEKRSIKEFDERLSPDRLKYGTNETALELPENPTQDIKPGIGNNLGQSMSALGNAINTLTQPLSQQAKQLERSAMSTITSWTDPTKLVGSLVNAGTKELKKLMMGNIFGNNLTNIGSMVNSQINRFSSNNVVSNLMSGTGWTRKSSDETIPSSSLKKSLNKSITTPRVPKAPSGNIFRQ